MKIITKAQIEQVFSYEEFIPFLKDFLKREISSPDRQHYTIPTLTGAEGNLLTMPSWETNEYMGVKIVSVFPDNKHLPSIQGSYLLLSAKNGELLCMIDGLALTIKRTASVSALASQFLSSDHVSSLLVAGTGNLCIDFVRAHVSVRALKQVWIWGRNFEKARMKSKQIKLKNCTVEAVEKLEPYLTKADIISCITLSDSALVPGSILKEDVYLDLVGSFKKHSREADNDCLTNANIFVDTYRAMEESGDLLLPLRGGIIKTEDIQADLIQLCRSEKVPRFRFPKTYFKSVGFAAPDLAIASYLYQKLKN